MVNLLQQATEFGITGKMRIAGLGSFIQDVLATDAKSSAGLLVTESFYWDLNDRTRAFYKRLKPRLAANVMPNSLHAAAYAGMTHYLKAVKQMGVAEARKSGAKTVAVMKSIPTDDDAFGPGSVRADGQMIAPVYLFQVKPLQDRTSKADVYALYATTPADKAFKPLVDSSCPLVKKG